MPIRAARRQVSGVARTNGALMEPPTHPRAKPPRVLLVCAGLEHARRGFESFARDCFDALRDVPELDVELIKGSGMSADRERSVPTVRRDSRTARALGRAFGFRPFLLEHVVFALSLQPVLLRHDPDVVYLSEWYTALVLARLRRLTGRRFKMVLCNGTMAVDDFGHLARVQQLTPTALEIALEHGADPARHTLLPLGFPIAPALQHLSDGERTALRARLGLPVDRTILVSVAALNRGHKRIDYLIEEVARAPEPRPYLLLAGETEPETAGLRRLAHTLLGEDGHSIRTVPQREVASLLDAGDLFVLSSLGEGLPRGLIEAMGRGLPCLVHDYPVARFALQAHGRYGDFSTPGGLASMLAHADPDRAGSADRHRFAYENFSWDRLRPRYVEMLRSVAHERAS
jgi:1,2-diacylglycerol 3-alpha-glucosyltransferase